MKKQLSALIDNELDIAEAEHILLAAKSNRDVKAAWQHYHMIGDAMRGDFDTDSDLSARVMAALDAEPTILAIKKPSDAPVQRKTKTPLFWSVAASVAAVMFVGLMVFEFQLNDAEDMAPVELAKSLPVEYLQAHQSIAPTGSSYYIQSASFTEKR